MHEGADRIRQRITELEQAAHKARIEAMQAAARLLCGRSAQLSATAPGTDTKDLAMLQARYLGLQSKIQDLQSKIDLLHVREHEHRHG
jgi:hypothetical protein